MSDAEDLKKKLQEAAENDEVHFCIPDREKDVLVDDGTGTTLGLVREMHLSPEVFGLCVTDGGGWSTCAVTVKQWEIMKQKVDAFIQSKQKAADKN